MRAGGREAGRARGGIRSPRGPFLRLWGVYARGPPSALGGVLCEGFFLARRFPMRGMFIRLGSAPRMRPSFAFWDGYR